MVSHKMNEISVTQTDEAAYFRPHRRMHVVHKMSYVAWSVCLSVSVVVILMYCAKTAEPIEMPFLGEGG